MYRRFAWGSAARRGHRALLRYSLFHLDVGTPRRGGARGPLDALAADGHAGGGSRWAYRYVGLAQAKGREALTPVYELLSADPPEVIERKLRLARWRSSQLDVPPAERSMPPAELEGDPLFATYCGEVLGMPTPSGISRCSTAYQ